MESKATVRRWRRCQPRVSTMSPCWLRQGDRAVRATITNLSQGGLRVRCEGPLPDARKPVTISFEVRGIAETFEAVGEVCEEGQRPGRRAEHEDEIHWAGIRFLKTTERHRRMLEAYVGLHHVKVRPRLPGLPPLRRPR